MSVDREKHQIIIRKAELTYPEVECTRDITLYATIENVGKDDEDDVELRLTNSALGLDERKTSIELDDYADDDNEHKAVFAVNVKDDATPGIYPLRLEVLREGDVEDSQELQLTVKDCLVLSKSAKQQTAYADAELAAQLQQQVIQSLQTKKQAAPAAKVSASFRESDTYVMLLGTLIVLALIALVLSLAVLVVKKKN